MPRPASVYHPLREVRRILGLSQVKLANRIDVAPITIKKIEGGQRLSGEIARRIAAETGVMPWDLIGENKTFRIYDGSPLSKESYELRKHRDATTPMSLVDEYVRNFAFHIEILLDASLDGESNKFSQVVSALYRSLSGIKHDFKLDKEVESILKDSEPHGAPWAPGDLYFQLLCVDGTRVQRKSKPGARSDRFASRIQHADILKNGVAIKQNRALSSKKPVRRSL
jgi:transcriptional regulator with XRE-family HTH domain